MLQAAEQAGMLPEIQRVLSRLSGMGLDTVKVGRDMGVDSQGRQGRWQWLWGRSLAVRV